MAGRKAWRVSFWPLLSLALLAAGEPIPAAAQAVRGAAAEPPAETLAACAACHGPAGHSPSPQFPSLAGQPKLFVENQLVLIREGLRDVPSMKTVMAGMGDEAIIALALYFSAQTPPRITASATPQRYRQGAQVSQRMLCGTCHLGDYRGQQQVPRLAGQNELYLLQAMKQFRDHPGPGRDTLMSEALQGLGDDDLASLAHYLSHYSP